ncbi:hypothetical protein AXG93_1515s1040 [Marchantia polymorpha subsp. ruderalis]|uniref:Uncharacterized protein n=1 Tax=Marchantia polymorpha subsp. ruderalis TaxID=1480154 RepID=A0A176WQD8_MARPO|nr:hypothetical protein AXG93_1515s1040 [Marchantia polymorpha subsp. ruderalis]
MTPHSSSSSRRSPRGISTSPSPSEKPKQQQSTVMPARPPFEQMSAKGRGPKRKAMERDVQRTEGRGGASACTITRREQKVKVWREDGRTGRRAKSRSPKSCELSAAEGSGAGAGAEAKGECIAEREREREGALLVCRERDGRGQEGMQMSLRLGGVLHAIGDSASLAAFGGLLGGLQS